MKPAICLAIAASLHEESWQTSTTLQIKWDQTKEVVTWPFLVLIVIIIINIIIINIKNNIINIASWAIWLWNTVSYIKGGIQAKVNWKQDPEANIWAQEGWEWGVEKAPQWETS